MDKKVGIITYYYDSVNYGGVLQAYALQKIIADLGFDCEQICYMSESKNSKSGLKRIIKGIISIKLRNRMLLFDCFRKSIPHSEIIYDSNSIIDITKKYEAFVVGSDQVWNLKWFFPAYYLDFVPQKKMTYAVSLGKDDFNDCEINFYKDIISKFDAVSIREASTVKSLHQRGIDVEYTLDPTLLLKRDDWNRISSDRMIMENYALCYFLGEDIASKKLTIEFAKNTKIKLVNIAHAGGLSKTDYIYHGHNIYDVGPREFISLIKHAEYVFTDSFHCSVFSCIYTKKFITFDRANKKGMGNRIYDLLKLFNCSERYCDSSEKSGIKYIENVIGNNYSADEFLKNEIIYSKKYLMNNLSKLIR